MAIGGFMGQAQQMQHQMNEQMAQMARLALTNRLNNGLGGSGIYNPNGVNLVGTEGNVPVQPGTLYINDRFIPSAAGDLISSGAETHGDIVAGAARRQGFSGPIVGNDRVVAGPQAIDRKSQAYYTALSTPGLSPAQTRANLQAYVGTNGASLLQQETRMLDRLTNSGATNSVVNFSQGNSKSSSVVGLYVDLMPALRIARDENDPNFAGANARLENIASAAGLDVNRLRSEDQSVRDKERGRMTQFLIDQVSQGMDTNADIVAARKGYDRSVNNFEARHNSVVISAGNEGNDLGDLIEAHGGYRLRAPADFSKSILENNEVTSVGAVELGATGREQRASYTSNSAGIDIYASGQTSSFGPSGAPIDGTSFAAPEVAAAMAQIHRANPGLTSSQVENLLRQQMSHQVTEPGQNISVLNRPEAPAPFMQNLSNGNFMGNGFPGGFTSGGFNGAGGSW